MQRYEWQFDTDDFMKAVRKQVGAGDASLRAIELQTGISASTFSRLDNGASPDMDTILRVCSTLNLNPSNYFKKILWKGEYVK